MASDHSVRNTSGGGPATTITITHSGATGIEHSPEVRSSRKNNEKNNFDKRMVYGAFVGALLLFGTVKYSPGNLEKFNVLGVGKAASPTCGYFSRRWMT